MTAVRNTAEAGSSLQVDAGGNTINSEGEMSLLEFGAAAFPWTGDKGPLYVLSNNFYEQLMRRPAVLLLCEGIAKADLRSAKEKLLNVAKPFVGSGIVFGYSFQTTELSRQIRDFVGVDAVPALVLVDMTNQCKYVCSECSQGDLDEIHILNFIKQYARKQLPVHIKSAPRPPGDVNVLRPHLTPVVALSVEDLVFAAPSDLRGAVDESYVVLAVYVGLPPVWMLQISAAMMTSKVSAQELRFAELNVSQNDMDSRLKSCSQAGPPFVCIVGPNGEGVREVLSVHAGLLESRPVLDWMHAQLVDKVQFDLDHAVKELECVVELERDELSKHNMEFFEQMFDSIADVAQPSLENVLQLLQGQDSDEAGELMALLSKTDHDEMSAPLTREQWLQFWGAILELQGPFLPQELASLQSVLDLCGN